MEDWFINQNGELENRSFVLDRYDLNNIADRYKLENKYNIKLSIDNYNRVQVGNPPTRTFDLNNIADRTMFNTLMKDCRRY